MIDHSHPLLPIVMDCLRYLKNGRPSSEEFCDGLVGLKDTRKYMERVKSNMSRSRMT